MFKRFCRLPVKFIKPISHRTKPNDIVFKYNIQSIQVTQIVDYRECLALFIETINVFGYNPNITLTIVLYLPYSICTLFIFNRWQDIILKSVTG